MRSNGNAGKSNAKSSRNASRINVNGNRRGSDNSETEDPEAGTSKGKVMPRPAFCLTGFALKAYPSASDGTEWGGDGVRWTV